MAKILLIEDEPALQETLGEFLRSHGHSVSAASDGAAGLSEMRRRRPELVLLDLILPKMHGLDVLEAMRADSALAGIPVIVLTNVESSDSVERAVDLGAKAYLVKTNYALDEVLEKVESVLKDSASAFEPER